MKEHRDSVAGDINRTMQKLSRASNALNLDERTGIHALEGYLCRLDKSLNTNERALTDLILGVIR